MPSTISSSLLISGKDALDVIKTLGFESWEISNAAGFSGGIWVIWDSQQINLELIDCGKPLIHLRYCSGNKEVGVITVVYAIPNDHDRKELWQYIKNIEGRTKVPWLLTGDFNSITRPSQKIGGAPFNQAKVRDFNECINDCGLVDIGFSGPKFT
ncbi:unnamed protein product [Linum trigynum]|uniref:Endonuclease/exonuclease/phosphatase domain-containing protein n=1 Tax=Linum trigynum TaxID=586398 RepID=A0AAV2ED95_9ROSI